MNNENIQTHTPRPLFLHIPVPRLILLSIASCGLYEAYWIYKNWRYIKERDGLNIRPFWRGVFAGHIVCLVLGLIVWALTILTIGDNT